MILILIPFIYYFTKVKDEKNIYFRKKKLHNIHNVYIKYIYTKINKHNIIYKMHTNLLYIYIYIYKYI